MNTLGNKGRAKLLISVGTAMTVALMATGANAADTVIGPGGTPVAPTGHETAGTPQSNTAEILASIINATVGTDSDGAGDLATDTVSANSILATAVGDNFDDTIDLSLIANDVGGDGAGSLGFQMNSGEISSLVRTSDISIDFSQFQSGSVANTDNTIAAKSTANAGSTSLAGAIPNTYTSTAPGSTELTSGIPLADWLDASGSLVASTVQVNAGSGAEGINTHARSDANEITLDLVSPAANTIAASPQLDRNSTDASAQGNSSTSSIDVQAGGAPALAASAVLTNGQINVGTGGDRIVGRNNDSLIFTTIQATAGTNTIAGGLTVDDNTASSSASGNEALGSNGTAGNSVTFGNGVSFDGAGAASASTNIAYNTSTMDGTVGADVAVFNSQGNIGAANGDRIDIRARTVRPTIGADVQAIDGGSISVSGNAATSLARGNVATSAFSDGTGVAHFDGTVAVANQQTNVYTDVSARTRDTDLGVSVAFLGATTLPDSSVSVDGNTSSAAAYGNQASQSLDLSATTSDLPQDDAVLSGGTGPDGNIHTAGNVTVANLQSVYSSDVSATDSGDIYLDADGTDTIDTSMLEVINNLQRAFAFGDSGANELSVSGTIPSAGVGLASVQIVADDSHIDATDASQARIRAAGVDGSSLEVSGNVQFALAYGASVSNDLNLTAQTLGTNTSGPSSTITYDPAATNGLVLDHTTPPSIDSANGLLNDQSVSGPITARAGQADSFLVTVDGSVTDGGSLSNGGHLEDGVLVNGQLEDNVPIGGNSLLAAAYGTDAVNMADLDVGELFSAANNPNYEDVLALANAQTVTEGSAISAEASGGAVVDTAVTGGLNAADVSTSANIVQAVASGNGVTNQLIVDATNVTTNLSNNNGNLDIIPAGTAGASSQVRSSFSVNNVQSAGGTIDATLLHNNRATEVLTTIGDDVADSSVTSDGNTLTAAAGGNGATNGLTIDGNSIASNALIANYQDLRADLSATIGIAGVGDPNEGSVIVAFDGGIGDSSVSVSDNTTAGSVIGNSATNTLSVSGTTLTAGVVQTASTVTTRNTGWTDLNSDYGIANSQVAQTVSLVSDVFGSFGVDMIDPETIADATIDVDGNTQSSRALINTAANSLTLAANGATAGSALSSDQTDGGDTAVSALSDLDIFAPAASDTSSVSLSDNSNLAVSVINDVTNTLTITATNLDPKTAANDATLTKPANNRPSSTGDDLLQNQQTASGSTTAVAATTIANDDAGAATTPGLIDGSVTITGNSTHAEASANGAYNRADISAGSSLAASAGVNNLQQSSAGVSASASTTAGVTLAGDVGNAALNGSSVQLGDNTTSSLARGNAATNVLNYTGGANYGTPTGLAVAGSSIDPTADTASTSARAAVLNSQNNSGSVTASTTDTSYQVALNSGGGGLASLTGGTVGVIGNSVSAAAYGNTANNVVQLASLNTNVPTAAIGNYQTNSGAVTASVTTVSYGVSSGLGSVTGSSIGVTGNTISATAVGNNASSTIGAH